jgi:hypothetical protein
VTSRVRSGAVSHALRLVGWLLMGLVVVAVAGCSGCRSCGSKTDAERAAEERAKADEIWKKSYALLPWRAIKGAARSQGAPNRPEVYRRVDVALAALAAPATGDAERDAKLRSDACVQLLTYLVLHRDELAKHDEDEFPRLANLWTGSEPPLPAPWYDNAAEHLFAALGVLLVDATDKSDRVPARDIVFYELSRAPAQEAWPRPLRLAGRYARGVSYLQHDFFFASDEELTAYLDEIESAPEADFAVAAEIGSGGVSWARTAEGKPAPPAVVLREVLRAAGYFTRAYVRTKLDRDEAATDDTEKGLEALDRIGIENELTMWGWALVHQRRGRYEESARSLEKLAESPYLDERAKTDIRAAAADMKKHEGSASWFHQQKTTAAIVQALVARAGGAENILAVVLGPERAKQIFAPFLAISSARETLRDMAMKERGRFDGLAGGAKESGKKALGGLRDRLTDGGAAAPATSAGPAAE